ncbi:hypothetical protein C8C83_0985 [Flavobacterium sp. 90]|uniref:hypothetical protein n=1 Tax=unclassified Flavobacterium TaxID=196869 RepID=UPI000EAB85B8|nr:MULTISPECIES: hypothetical protein [unclassified Flavobacterium]RKR09360.1 hypothetical protein C8C82_1285 [Flavobacterium sp. 81]TCK53144.1 hypothetical protein C8C83_0985 [Flavobacterium sp. 90]
MKTKVLFIGTLVALSFFISCNSDEKTNDGTTTAISNNEIITASKIDASIEDVTNIAEDQFNAQQNTTAKPGGPVKNFLPSCATITTVLTNNTWTKTVDFGVEGCTLDNGNVVKGKMVISFANDFSASTQTISYTFDGFYHNGKKLQGSKSIVRTIKTTNLLATAHPVSTATIDMTITFDDGGVYTRKGSLVKEMVTGYDTWFNWEDNAYLVTGSGTTTFPNGDTFSAEITTPLEFDSSCRKPFAVKGVVSITKNGTTAVVDYGDGNCDTLAKVTKDGVTEEIDLKK